MEKLLSNFEVEDIVGEKLPITISSNFHKINNIDELLNENGTGLIMYDDKKNNKQVSGHWCGLKLISPDDLVFYDSYGTYPDDELNNIPNKYRQENNQVCRHLTKLLHNSNYKNLHFNPHQHQEHKKGVNTCGRHVGVFLKLAGDPEDYNTIMSNVVKTLGLKNEDELIVNLTEPSIIGSGAFSDYSEDYSTDSSDLEDIIYDLPKFNQ